MWNLFMNVWWPEIAVLGATWKLVGLGEGLSPYNALANKALRGEVMGCHTVNCELCFGAARLSFSSFFSL